MFCGECDVLVRASGAELLDPLGIGEQRAPDGNHVEFTPLVLSFETLQSGDSRCSFAGECRREHGIESDRTDGDGRNPVSFFVQPARPSVPSSPSSSANAGSQ